MRKPMSPRRLLLPSLALSLVLAACASGGGGGTSSPRIDQNRITEEELLPNNDLDVLTVIERLRPQWLQTRGNTWIQVIVDGVVEPGGVDSLRSIMVVDVREVRRPWDVASGGTIIIERKR